MGGKRRKKRPKKITRASSSLTAKQARFVEEYLIDLNATNAAIRAKYSKKTAGAAGARLLKNVKVATEISKRQKAVSSKLECSLNDIAAELYKLGFANMADYMKVGKDGDPHLDFSRLTREQAAALAEVTVDDYIEGRGEEAREVRRVKFKLADKKGSLVELAKLLGYMPTRHEHTGKDGAPIDFTIKIDDNRDLQ